MKTRMLYIYAYMPARNIQYNSEHESYNTMHLWYANRGQNISLRRRRDSNPSGRWRHPRIPTRIPSHARRSFISRYRESLLLYLVYLKGHQIALVFNVSILDNCIDNYKKKVRRNIKTKDGGKKIGDSICTSHLHTR